MIRLFWDEESVGPPAPAHEIRLIYFNKIRHIFIDVRKNIYEFSPQRKQKFSGGGKQNYQNQMPIKLTLLTPHLWRALISWRVQVLYFLAPSQYFANRGYNPNIQF